MKVDFVSPFTKIWPRAESKINTTVLVLNVLHNSVQTIYTSRCKMPVRRGRDACRVARTVLCDEPVFCIGNVIDM